MVMLLVTVMVMVMMLMMTVSGVGSSDLWREREMKCDRSVGAGDVVTLCSVTRHVCHNCHELS